MKNKLIIFTGPSAVGKASIEKELFQNEELKLQLSISATTRKPREGEIDGMHYYFISSKEFDEKIKNNDFIEWNEHFSNKYGTLKSEITRIQKLNKIPFIEVEVIGAKNIINDYKDESIISIFIAPPSIEDLEKRMINRATETKEQIQERLCRVEKELGYKHIFDFVIINDEIKIASKKIKKIIQSEIL